MRLLITVTYIIVETQFVLSFFVFFSKLPFLKGRSENLNKLFYFMLYKEQEISSIFKT